MKLSHLKNIIRESIKQLNEKDIYVSVSCCDNCGCSAAVVGGIVQDCCLKHCRELCKQGSGNISRGNNQRLRE